MITTLRDLQIQLIVLLTSIVLIYSCSAPEIPSKNNFRINSVVQKDNNNSKLYKDLIQRANGYLRNEIYSILDKKFLPPSGDMHDYISYAIYYWPDTSEQSNVWVYKDGKVNESTFYKTDRSNLYDMYSAIKSLSVAYHLSKDEKYAEKTAAYIKTWFVNDSTRMNPNMRYAQGIPGKYDGTPSGIIESRGFIWVIDAVNFIMESNYWSENDNKIFKDWIRQYLNWLTHSEFALRESEMKNNHGTFYDLQKLKYADFIGADSLAISAIESLKMNRIRKQIAPDGSQPEEIKRTKKFHYSLFNLTAFVQAAVIAENYSLDLWTYKDEDSGSILDAVKYLTLPLTQDESGIFTGEEINYRFLLPVLLKAINNGFNQFSDLIPQLEAQIDYRRLTDLYFFN